MTRLEEQISEMEAKVVMYKSFSEEKLRIFRSVENKVDKLLSSYGITYIDRDNCFIDKSVIGEDCLIFRIFLNVEGVNKLSELRKKNLEKKLRSLVPMPICPISYKSIHICYHN